MDDNKVYEPIEVQPVPFPQQDQPFLAEVLGGGGKSGQFSPPSLTPSFFPKKQVSYELLSTMLNTQSKKIRGQFDLVDSGGFRIGKYEPGVSGEMVLTPAGQTVKNTAGQTTFNIDGDTGDVSLAGIVRAKDVEVINSGGLVSLANFATTNVSTDGLNQQITHTESDGYEDITNASFTFSLSRDTILLINAKVTFWTGGTGVAVDPLIGINIDGVTPGVSGKHRIWYRDPSSVVTSSMHRVEILSAGVHTMKLQGAINYFSGSPILYIYNYYFSYVAFGN